MSEEKDSELASWIMTKVSAWESWRDTNYQDRWDEYYRLWRGVWTEKDKSRNSERSRIICPELAQTVETMVAELEDATFIRERWVDVSDDVLDEDPTDIEEAIKRLLEEFHTNGVPDAISEAYFNGALYGTGIAKIIVDKVKEPAIDTNTDIPSISFKDKIVVKVVPISPRHFAIDPNARSIEEALGCAHIVKVPLTSVQKKISNGIYRPVPLAPFFNSVEDVEELGEIGTFDQNSDACKIIEYHGLVPKRLLTKTETLFDTIETAIEETVDTTVKPVKDSAADETLVEAIVTIVNDSFVARAVANPFLMGDRSIVAYQHDTVPDRFWGRGVAEKGYNPQKALDAEIRARIDALSLSTHPMMAIDATKIPRGETFAVRPGRNILTSGNPAEALMPLKFPPPDPHTFQQTQELREMIQRGTGGYELPGAMSDANRMAATSMSMVVGSMIKRSRRTLANIEREFLQPLVQKALWRYMQFNPELFPMRDYKFKVRATMGIMAREFEQGQLVSLLSTVPPDSPAYWMLIKGIYTNSAIEDREAMIKIADQMIEQAMNPQPPPPDPKVELDKARLEFEKEKWLDERDLETRKLQQIDDGIQAEAKRDIGEGYMQTATAALQMVKAETEQLRAQAEAYKMMSEAQKAQIEASLAAFQAKLEGMLAMKDASNPPQVEEHESETSKPDGTRTVKRVRKGPEKITSTESEPNETEEDDSESGEEMEVEAEKNPVLEKLEMLLQNQIQLMEASKSPVAATPQQDFSGVFDKLTSVIEGLNQKVDALSKPKKRTRKAPTIERGPDGKVVSVDGVPVQRNEQGLIAGLEGPLPEE